jgi:rod shape-determining protein MreC
MDNFFTRYRNEVVLVAILFVQVIALATQVRVPDRNSQAIGNQGGTTRLIRVWASGFAAPFQRLAVASGGGIRGIWTNYIDLRKTREENERLQKELNELRLQQVRMEQDASQGKRLQALLDFKEQYIGKTIAAQVIGTSGTDLSQVIYIDRGTNNGVEAGMAVITPDGIVGKVSRADKRTSQVLLITDPNSGAGVIIERLRTNGILKGTIRGYPEVLNVMADEEIKPGDKIITTGGDRVFPKGLPVGVVEKVEKDKDRDPFLAIRVKPAVNLGKLEEVLVITELAERDQSASAEGTSGPMRAADILAQRLPSAKKKTEEKSDAPKVSDIPAVVTPPEPGVFRQPSAKPSQGGGQSKPNTTAQTETASSTNPNSTTPKKAAPKTQTQNPNQQQPQPSTPPPGERR